MDVVQGWPAELVYGLLEHMSVRSLFTFLSCDAKTRAMMLTEPYVARTAIKAFMENHLEVASAPRLDPTEWREARMLKKGLVHINRHKATRDQLRPSYARKNPPCAKPHREDFALMVQVIYNQLLYSLGIHDACDPKTARVNQAERTSAAAQVLHAIFHGFNSTLTDKIKRHLSFRVLLDAIRLHHHDHKPHPVESAATDDARKPVAKKRRKNKKQKSGTTASAAAVATRTKISESDRVASQLENIRRGDCSGYVASLHLGHGRHASRVEELLRVIWREDDDPCAARDIPAHPSVTTKALSQDEDKPKDDRWVANKFIWKMAFVCISEDIPFSQYICMFFPKLDTTVPKANLKTFEFLAAHGFVDRSVATFVSLPKKNLSVDDSACIANIMRHKIVTNTAWTNRQVVVDLLTMPHVTDDVATQTLQLLLRDQQLNNHFEKCMVERTISIAIMFGREIVAKRLMELVGERSPHPDGWMDELEEYVMEHVHAGDNAIVKNVSPSMVIIARRVLGKENCQLGAEKYLQILMSQMDKKQNRDALVALYNQPDQQVQRIQCSDIFVFYREELAKLWDACKLVLPPEQLCSPWFLILAVRAGNTKLIQKLLRHSPIRDDMIQPLVNHAFLVQGRSYKFLVRHGFSRCDARLSTMSLGSKKRPCRLHIRHSNIRTTHGACEAAPSFDNVPDRNGFHTFLEPSSGRIVPPDEYEKWLSATIPCTGDEGGNDYQ